MRIEIRVARGAARRWHRDLAERLERTLAPADVRIRATEGGATWPGSVDALLALERIVLRRSQPTPADRLQPADLGPAPSPETPDIVIDCTGRETCEATRAVRELQPLYAGEPSERALAASLLAGAIPEVSVSDATSGRIVATGRPGGGAPGLTGGIEAVTSRLMMLLEEAIRAPRFDAPSPRREPLPVRGALTYALAKLKGDCARAIFHLAFDTPHWRVGWRLHDGPGVLERGDLGGTGWTVLADPGRSFFADPFPVTWQGRTAVFVEELDHRVGKGVISAIPFGPEGPTGGAVPVIEEPWHLSYPFVVEHSGELYLVPESSLTRKLWIYRSLRFPDRWERCGMLLDGIEASDATLFRHAGRWWMTSSTREGAGGYSDTLTIHHADDLFGPWTPHAQRPALVDISAARPAGRVVVRDGRLWRPVQDCARGYGRALALAEIEELTPDRFRQTIRHRITPGPLWPGRALHTLNRSGRLECIDGAIHAPKLGVARAAMDRRMRPQQAQMIQASGE